MYLFSFQLSNHVRLFSKICDWKCALLVFLAAIASVASAQIDFEIVELKLSGNLLETRNTNRVNVRVRGYGGPEWSEIYAEGEDNPIQSTLSTTAQVPVNGCSYVVFYSEMKFLASDVEIRLGEEIVRDLKGPFSPKFDRPYNYVLAALVGNGCHLKPACNNDEILFELEALELFEFNKFALIDTMTNTDLSSELVERFGRTSNNRTSSLFRVRTSYVQDHLCLPRDGCYRFSRSDRWGGYDYGIFNVTIDGLQIEGFPSLYLQIEDFGEGESCPGICGEGESVLDMYIEPEIGHWDVVDLTWSVSDETTGADFSGVAGTRTDVVNDYFRRTDVNNNYFNRLCVPKGQCYLFGLSVPPTFELPNGWNFHVGGSYILVLENLIYGSQFFLLGRDDTTVGDPPVAFQESTFVGVCSSEVCASGKSFLEVETVVRQHTGIEWWGRRWWLEGHNAITHRKFAKTLKYQYYECLDLTNVACARLEKDINHGGIFEVTLDGTVMEGYQATVQRHCNIPVAGSTGDVQAGYCMEDSYLYDLAGTDCPVDWATEEPAVTVAPSESAARGTVAPTESVDRGTVSPSKSAARGTVAPTESVGRGTVSPSKSAARTYSTRTIAHIIIIVATASPLLSLALFSN